MSSNVQGKSAFPLAVRGSRTGPPYVSVIVSPVITTLHAGAQIGTRSALRAQVKKRLEGILGVAVEMKHLPGGYIPREARMVTRVDGHDVWYSLDREEGFATIVSVDPAGSRAAFDDQAAATSIARVAR